MTFFTHGKFPWIARALIGCWHCLIACQGWDLQLYLGFGDVRKLQKILFIILQYFFINANMRSQLVFQVEYLHCCFYFISFMVNNIVYREFLISGVKKVHIQSITGYFYGLLLVDLLHVCAYLNVILLAFPCLTYPHETALIESANKIFTTVGYPMLKFIICKQQRLCFSSVSVAV